MYATGSAADRGPVLHDSVLGAEGDQLVRAGGRAVGEGRAPRVVALDLFHRHACAVEDVGRRILRGGRAVHVAQRHREGVDDVLSGRRRAPRVVLAAAELNVEVEAGERGAARADARALQLLEHEQLRGEVAGLRTEYRDGMAVVGVLAGHDQRVGHAVALGEKITRQHSVVEDALCRVQRRIELDVAGRRARLRGCCC